MLRLAPLNGFHSSPTSVCGFFHSPDWLVTTCQKQGGNTLLRMHRGSDLSCCRRCLFCRGFLCCDRCQRTAAASENKPTARQPQIYYQILGSCTLFCYQSTVATQVRSPTCYLSASVWISVWIDGSAAKPINTRQTVRANQLQTTPLTRDKQQDGSDRIAKREMGSSDLTAGANRLWETRNVIQAGFFQFHNYNIVPAVWGRTHHFNGLRSKLRLIRKPFQ